MLSIQSCDFTCRKKNLNIQYHKKITGVNLCSQRSAAEYGTEIVQFLLAEHHQAIA